MNDKKEINEFFIFLKTLAINKKYINRIEKILNDMLMQNQKSK